MAHVKAAVNQSYKCCQLKTFSTFPERQVNLLNKFFRFPFISLRFFLDFTRFLTYTNYPKLTQTVLEYFSIALIYRRCVYLYMLLIYSEAKLDNHLTSDWKPAMVSNNVTIKREIRDRLEPGIYLAFITEYMDESLILLKIKQ